MNFEKLVNSKINGVADWIIRLIMINVFMIFTSLLIVTIYPSISAGYNMFNDYTNNKDTKLFKGYFAYFKENLPRKIVVSILISIGLLIGVTNIMYYNSSLNKGESFFLNVGYFVTLSLMVIFYATSIYTVVIARVSSEMKYRSLFKLAFFLAGKNYFTTVLLILVSSIPFILFFFPQLFIVVIMMGISIPLLIQVYLTNHIVYYLEGLGKNNDETGN